MKDLLFLSGSAQLYNALRSVFDFLPPFEVFRRAAQGTALTELLNEAQLFENDVYDPSSVIYTHVFLIRHAGYLIRIEGCHVLVLAPPQSLHELLCKLRETTPDCNATVTTTDGDYTFHEYVQQFCSQQ